MAEGRIRPVQRQDGFNVPAVNGSHAEGKGADDNAQHSRIRTATGDTLKAPDGDVEMGDDKRGILPLPIPGSSANGSSASTVHAESINELKTPPDDALLAPSRSSHGKTGASLTPGLASPQVRAMGPRLSALASSHVSSGPASFSSAQYSPGKSSDARLHSLSGQPYSNASVKPYLSTSFQLSAERGSSRDRMRQPRGIDDMDDNDDDDEDENVDDVFGNIGGSLGLRQRPDPSPPHERQRQSGDLTREEGDAAGVFDFSSPCFGPRALGTSDVPPMSPQLASEDAQRRAQRVMSPGWTAASLGKLSLGGPSTDLSSGSNASSSTSRRPPLGTSPRRSLVAPSSAAPASSSAHTPYSRSLPSNNQGSSLSHQQRRLSNNRRPHMVASSLWQSQNGRPRGSAENRARSTSRHRTDLLAVPSSSRVQEAGDDDETDEDEIMRQGMEEDDDATEDESESKLGPAYLRQYTRYDDGLSVPPRHPSGQQTTMSASYERAQNGLNRQFSNERYTHLGVGRHHPYAASPGGTSVGSAALLGYSPSNGRAPFHHRKSSFGSNTALSASPSSGVILSHSPRYAPAMTARDMYSGSLPHYGMQPHAHAMGSSPDSRAFYESRQYPATIDDEGDDEEEEDEEEGNAQDADDDEEEEEKEEAEHKAKRAPIKQGRSSSSSRAAGNANGEVDSPEMNEVNAIRDRLGGAANCSAFISKLWYLMCRPQLYSKYIHWSESGDSVILINDPDINNEFAAAVLPKLFKHGNNASFVRQLNLYGFQRVPSSRLLDAAEAEAARRLPQGASISTALQLYGPHSSFAHPRFKKDQEVMLPSMKPRSSKKTKKSGANGAVADASAGAGGEGEDEDA